MGGLMHPRVAHNYAAKGYYPTDDATLRGISHLFAPSQEAITFLDPCCGTGAALASLASKNRYPFAKAYGIELDEQRAGSAKTLLNGSVLHASALEAQVTMQSVDCLFLNPPYGWDLKDNDADEKSERLEHRFLSQTFSWLKSGGIIIAILPKTSLDRKTQNWFAMRFVNLQVFEAATNRFDQIVIIGEKRYGTAAIDKAWNAKFDAWQNGDIPWNTLPDATIAKELQYHITGNDKTFKMFAKAIDTEGLEAVKKDCHNLWQSFDAQFVRASDTQSIRPLYQLTDWHTCLLITSGVVGGIVDNGKRRLLIKGRTMKIQTIKNLENDEGELVSSQHRDRFQTIIKAIDLTASSKSYGQIIDIR